MQSNIPEPVSGGWRSNFARLGDAIEASPLPTRQMKRKTARQLARTLATVQKGEARKQARLAMKGRRADRAAAKHAS